MAAAMGQWIGKTERVRFGGFELDRAERRLWKGGRAIAVQRMPLAFLELLLERAGALVTREEARARLWADGTHVDFEHGVNTALKKLRRALGDDARNPRFIETVSRHGFRFVAPVSACRGASTRTRPPANRSLVEEFAARAALSVPLTGDELAALRQLLDASIAPSAPRSREAQHAA